MTMNCIAVDDEALALDLLADNISRIPFLTLVGKCKNVFEAIDLLKENKIDLIFLDIQMPGLSGIQFVKSMSNLPMVIFTTAYSKYALDSYEFDVVDYLVKPIEFDRFLKASNKAYDLFCLKTKQVPTSLKKADYIFINVEYSLVKVFISDIRYIEGLKDYLKIYTSTSAKPYITRLNLKALEESLPSQFARVHKSYIVNINKIATIRRNKIAIDSVHIPIGESYKENFYQLISSFNGNIGKP